MINLSQSSANTAQSTAEGRARSQIIQYTGTGTYGESNPNRLSFNGKLNMVILLAGGVKNDHDMGVGVMIQGSQSGTSIMSRTSYPLSVLYVTWSGSSISWYATSDDSSDYLRAHTQFNRQGSRYFAIGFY